MSTRREKSSPPKEKDDNMIQLGKFFYSLSGLTYAGVIITKVIDFRYGDAEMLYWGVIATVILATIAWLLVKFGNIKR